MAYCTAKQINCHLSRRQLLLGGDDESKLIGSPPSCCVRAAAIDFALLFLAGARRSYLSSLLDHVLLCFVLYDSLHLTGKLHSIIYPTCPLQLTRHDHAR